MRKCTYVHGGGARAIRYKTHAIFMGQVRMCTTARRRTCFWGTASETALPGNQRDVLAPFSIQLGLQRQRERHERTIGSGLECKWRRSHFGAAVGIQEVDKLVHLTHSHPPVNYPVQTNINNTGYESTVCMRRFTAIRSAAESTRDELAAKGTRVVPELQQPPKTQASSHV